MGKKQRDRVKNAEKQDSGDEGPASVQDHVRTLGDQDATDEDEEILVPKKKQQQQEETRATADGSEHRTERPEWSRKQHRPSGRRLQAASIRVKIGGRQFSGQTLKAYGLNAKKLYFRQQGSRKSKVQERKGKQKTPK